MEKSRRGGERRWSAGVCGKGCRCMMKADDVSGL